MEKTYSILINYHTSSYVTREGDPNEQYDGDDVDNSHSIYGFKLAKSYGGDITLTYEPQFDRDYFLLYYLWSTGDSFSYESGKIEFVDLYETSEEAELAKKKIEQHYETRNTPGNKRTNGPIIKYSNGTKAELTVPYYGYFESLESVEVQTIRLER